MIPKEIQEKYEKKVIEEQRKKKKDELFLNYLRMDICPFCGVEGRVSLANETASQQVIWCSSCDGKYYLNSYHR